MGWGPLNAVATFGALHDRGQRRPLHRQRLRQPAARCRGAATTRGAAARSSGRSPRRRRPATSRRSPSCTDATRSGSRSTSRRTSAGCRTESRELLMTTVLDAGPDTRESFPVPTPWPFVGALATTVLFVGLDLHAVGGRLGQPARGDRPDRVVLAAATSNGLPPRAGKAAMSSGESTREAALRRRETGPQAERHGPALDVSGLASFGFSHRSLMWWGTLGLMLIEGMVFALAVVVYFFLRSHSEHWPMSTPPPELRWGTVNTLVLLVSMWPNHLAKRAAERLDRRGVQIWLTACLLAGVDLPRRAGDRILGAERALGHRRLRLDRVDAARPAHLHLVTDTWDTAVLPPCFSPAPSKGGASSTSARTRSTGTSWC